MVIYTELLNKLLNSKICLRRQNDMRLIFATEYPVGALPGEAMAAFTTLAQDALGAELEIDSLFETEQISLGERAASTIVLDGGVVFGAALSGYSKEFELAAIPRGIGSCDAEKDARQFRDIFAKCLYREGFRLIASVPMPPTGLWSSHVIDSEADLTSLRIRTYDSLSAEVFSSLGCAAMKMSFAQLPPALDKGEINAVLSSGDGAAGASLSRYFRYYSPLAYSTPLCFLIVRESSFVAMPGRWQRALRWAGREVQSRYFMRQVTREKSNLKAMQERGVVIGSDLPHNVVARLEGKMELVRRRLIAEHALAEVLVQIA